MYFGNVSGTTITMAYNRVEKEITQNKRIKGKLKDVTPFSLSDCGRYVLGNKYGKKIFN